MEEPDFKRRKSDLNQDLMTRLLETEHMETRVVANILQIENLKDDLEEFKNDVKKRLTRIEGWLMSTLGIILTGVIGVVGTVALKFLG
jgi:hypothetical protein